MMNKMYMLNPRINREVDHVIVQGIEPTFLYSVNETM